jgi:hypothetical protein
MPYALEPLRAGELGMGTELDVGTHPPGVRRVEYVLDAPTEEDLIKSFPVFLVSEELAAALTSEKLSGFQLDDADVHLNDQYVELHESAPHKRYRWLRLTPSESADCWLNDQYRLCVSDRMYAVISHHCIDRCDVTTTS